MATEKLRQQKMNYQKSEKGKKAHRKADNKYKKRWIGKWKKEREKQYVEQNGCCGICGKPVSYSESAYDHNHTTGQYRQILCILCNLFVGYIEKYPNLVEPIQKYLEYFDGKQEKPKLPKMNVWSKQ